MEIKNVETIEDVQPMKALDTVVSLLEESDPTDLIDSVDIVDLLQQQVEPTKIEPEPSTCLPTFKKKTDKFPHLSKNVNLEAFVNLVSADLKKIKKNTFRSNGNLTKEEKTALKSLIMS